MQTEMLIGGAFTAGENSPETVLNPRTGAAIAEVPEASEAQVDAAVAGGGGAFEGWSRTTPAERSAALLRIADRIEAEADGFAALEALNCGKPINAMKGDEIPAIADCWRFFAGAVRCQHGAIAGEYLAGHTSMIRRDPVGVVGLGRALELSADDDGLEARPGGRRRQHRRLQALGDDAADGAEARPRSSPRSCRPGWSTSSPAAAPASGARWSTTPAST